MAVLTGMLADPYCRLLTIVGPGGVGKTRLAIELAAKVAGEFQDGTYFVDLQSVSATDFYSALANALSVTLPGQSLPAAHLQNMLADRALLLFLDNFEHLHRHAPFLSEVLHRAPLVKILVTSREVLHLQEEWRYPLAGLAVPPESSGHGLEDIEAYGSVALFLHRARRVRPAFSVGDEPGSVARICRLVEGLPLALELAASWAHALSCDEIADEIERHQAFLATSARDVPERHRNMQAVFEQSWRLLTDEERRVFKQLSLFRGGFQRAAAEAVASAALPILSTLVGKCMVRHAGRYDIHELLRQFGEEQLQLWPEVARAARVRHVETYADFLFHRLDAINGAHQRVAADEIAAEWENVRAAWQRAVEDANLDALFRMASTYFYFCQLRSRFLEGATALQTASTRIEPLPASRQRDLTLARLLNHEGWLRIRVGAFDRARRVLEWSLALYGQLAVPPPPTMGGDSSVPLAITALIQGDSAWAVALCESARHAAEGRGDTQNLAFAHYGLTAARLAQGDYAAAYRHAERACALARAAGNHWFLAYPLIEWGNVARANGNDAEAEQHYRAAYAIKEAFDDPEGMAITLCHLGEIAVMQRRYPEASRCFQKSLEHYSALSDRGGLATCYRGLGQVAHARQEFMVASAWFRKALQIGSEIQFWPLVHAVMVDAAALLGAWEKSSLAVALLTWVEHQPSGDREIRDRAGQHLVRYREERPGAEFATATQQGATWAIDTLLATLDSVFAAAAEADSSSTSPAPSLIEPLTERERDVLLLLVKGYSNAAIAERLVLAVGSVKWYASQIYGKLGVANRTQAAARARDLGLLAR